MRSEGFPFIVWGSGGWTLVRLQLLVASPSRRRSVVVAPSSRRPLIPCLWGKLQNLFFLKVIKQVVMSFCVAGVALCDIPTCLITCRKRQNWRRSRTKRSFCCAHVFRLGSLVFLWRCCVYGGSCKTVSRLEFLLFLWRRRVYGGSCKTSVFAFPVAKLQNLARFAALTSVSSRVSAFPLALRCLYGGSCKTSLVLLRPRRRVYRGSCKTSLVLLCPRRRVYGGSSTQ